jgi:DNA-binding LacI/PurR family transcriptional regulator
MAATMQQIADRCVSKQTVSCILNGKGHLYAAATRARVEQAARALGYHPNLAAVAIARRRHGCIGLAVSQDVYNALWTPQLYLSIAEAATRHGSLVMLLEIPAGRKALGFFRACADLPCDGLLLNFVSHPSRGILATLAASDKPTVWLNNRLPMNAVYPDDQGTAAALTRRLLDQGHRRIAYVHHAGQPLDIGNHYSMVERWQGYAETVTAAGGKPQLICSRQAPHGIQGLIVAAREVFADAQTRPTAVITYGPTGAEGILHAAQMAGMAVPKDLSLATFNEIRPVVLGLSPETAPIPFAEMGRQAVEMLFDLVANPGTPCRSRRLPYSAILNGNLSGQKSPIHRNMAGDGHATTPRASRTHWPRHKASVKHGMPEGPRRQAAWATYRPDNP